MSPRILYDFKYDGDIVYIDVKGYEVILDKNIFDNYIKGKTIYIRKSSNNYYSYIFRDYKYIQIHRLIMNPPKEMLVDHKNHNTLDNRIDNLRIVDKFKNQQNRKGANKNNKSTGIRGVSFNKRKQKYETYIGVDGKRIGLGYYETKEEAEQAVINARKKYYK